MFTTPTASPSKKRLKFAPRAALGESRRTNIDWGSCCLCGEGARAGPLKCPANNPVSSQRFTGYTTMAGILAEFGALGLLPKSLNIRALQGDAESLETSFIQNRAQWHIACGLKYNRQSLTRLKKQQEKENQNLFKVEPTTPSPSTPILGKRSRTPKTPGDTLHTAQVICVLCGEGPAWNNRLVQLSNPKVEEQLKQIGQSHPNPTVKGSIAGITSQGSLLRKDTKVRYHLKCLQKCLYEAGQKGKDSDPGWQICESITFSDIVNHITDETSRHGSNVVFKMGLLAKMYNDRLGVLLGVDPRTLPPVHTTRLRERILLKVPDLEARLEGREYSLLPSKAAFLNAVCDEDTDENGIVFDRFIKLMRKELENHTYQFTGQFNQRCQENCVPPALLAMCFKMLYGSVPNVVNSSTMPAVTLAQLIFFNYKKYKREDSKIVRHQKIREPPLPVFVGLSTWGRTRMRQVVDTSHALGVSVSSFRIREITAALCQWVVDRAKRDKAVIPANLVVGVFTVLCYDNIDWNPASNTAFESFHGTSMSVLQMPTTDKLGVPFPLTPPAPNFTTSSTKIANLPSFFSDVQADLLSSDKPLHSLFVAPDRCKDMVSKRDFMECWKQEEQWLNHVEESYKIPLQNALNFSWSGFHASRQPDISLVPGINSLLPLFYEDSNSVSMVVHGKRIAKSTTLKVNPEQTPVFCCDQPLFATAKLIQWNKSEFSEEKIFIMFGSFHIEQSFLKVIGQFLEGSGLVEVMASSGEFTDQSVRSNLAVNSLKKSRAMHHILSSVLHILLRDAYSEENSESSFENWLKERCAESDLFLYWLLVLNLEVLLFRFVWSLRTRNYSEYCEALKSMLPWFFSMDRHNYARWLSIHVKDLVELPTIAPDVHREFQKGNFSFPISLAKLACVGFDQVHEQNNKIVKGDGGAIGLTQDPDALRRWTIGGPEVQRLLRDFEGPTQAESTLHHEQYPAFQENCRNQIQKVKEGFLAFRNPFLDSPKELLAIDTLIVIGDEGSSTLRKIEEAGRHQFEAFVRDRLESRKITLFQPIKKNNFRVFTVLKKKVDGRLVNVRALEADVELFSRLYMMAGSRHLDFHEFFRHENQGCPPSLSKQGSLYPHEKSELVPVLEKICPAACSTNPRADTLIFDGAALVHMLRPRQEKTFSDYWPMTLEVYVNQQQARYQASRIDLVWDMYFPNSIKTATRESRGVGVRRKVLPTTKIPVKSWADFLQNDENKSQLFPILAYDAIKGSPNALIVTNIGDTIVSTSHDQGVAGTYLAGASCGDMEEADGRIILHVSDAVENGSTRVVIRSVDTDVVVLAVSYFPQLSRLGLQELWVHFGTGKTQRLIACHSISTTFGVENSIALRGFHAISGCDFTSGFRGKRKATFFSGWMSYPQVTRAFLYISEPQRREDFEDEIYKIIENFIIFLYGASFQVETLVELRKELYTKKGKKLQALPPTSNTLRCHVLRSAYVSGQIWGQACRKAPSIPSPVGWGWTSNEGKFAIEWSDLPPIWEAVRTLLSQCGCSTGCNGKRCKCWALGQSCTIFCRCQGCQNEKPPDPVSVSLHPEADDQDPDEPDAVPATCVL